MISDRFVIHPLRGCYSDSAQVRLSFIAPRAPYVSPRVSICSSIRYNFEAFQIARLIGEQERKAKQVSLSLVRRCVVCGE